MQLSEAVRVASALSLMELEMEDEVRTAARAAWDVCLARETAVDACLSAICEEGRREGKATPKS
jgi:hypothetical protein